MSRIAPLMGLTLTLTPSPTGVKTPAGFQLPLMDASTNANPRLLMRRRVVPLTRVLKSDASAFGKTRIDVACGSSPDWVATKRTGLRTSLSDGTQRTSTAPVCPAAIAGIRMLTGRRALLLDLSWMVNGSASPLPRLMKRMRMAVGRPAVGRMLVGRMPVMWTSEG